MSDFMIIGGFWRFSKGVNALKFQWLAVKLRVPRGKCYLFGLSEIVNAHLKM